MKRRTLLMCAALVMSLAMAISGTLAYLTDTETTTNVMTVGNVDIELIELQRVIDEDGEYAKDENHEYVLEPFEDGKPLYPAVYELNDNGKIGNVVGIVDKEVRVKNVGSSEAFVRVVVAFPELNGKQITNDDRTELTTTSPIYVNYAFDDENMDIIHDVKINGKEHSLWVFTYPEKLAAGAESDSCMLNFFMNPNVTNEDLKGFTGEYRVLVAAQAMQTVNMDGKTAEEALNLGFKEISNESHPWSGMTTPIDMTSETTAGKKLVGDGTTVITNAYHITNNTVSDFIIDAGVGNAAVASRVTGENVFNDCVFVAEGTDRAFWADDVVEGATITFNNCTFKSAIKLGGNETNKYVFNNCTFSGKADWTKGLITAYAPIELNNCTFDHSAGAEYDVRLAEGVTSASVTVTGPGTVLVKNFGANHSGALEVVYEGYKPETSKPADTTTEGVIKYENENGETVQGVTSAEGLKNVQTDANKETTVVLMGDVDMGGAQLPSIFAGYAGTIDFDGNGHTITNVSPVTDKSNGMNNQGMFSSQAGTSITIKNMTIEGSNMTVGGSYNYGSAFLLGYNEGDVTFDNVHIKNSKITGDSSYKIGLFVGYSTGNVTLKNCSVEGCEIDGGRYGTVLVGQMNSGKTLTIENTTWDFGDDKACGSLLANSTVVIK